MAIVKKKAIAAKAEAPSDTDTTQETTVAHTAQTVSQPPAYTPPPANVNHPAASTPSWMMRGKKAQEARDAEAAQAEMNKEAAKRLFRFRLDMNESCQITFLDGNLDGDGLLDVLSYYEHTVKLDGKWQNFVCIGGGHGDHGSEPCPICEGGSHPALVSVFTVIDHRPYTIKKGPKTGQMIVNQRKLFVAKKGTLAKLQFKANTYKGLAGIRMNVARIGDDMTPGVGSEFDYVDRTPLDQLAAKYGEHGVPANYEQEILYLPAAKLIALGLGKAPVGPGYGNGTFNTQKMAEQI